MTQLTTDTSMLPSTPSQKAGGTLDIIVQAIDAHDNQLQLINEQVPYPFPSETTG